MAENRHRLIIGQILELGIVLVDARRADQRRRARQPARAVEAEIDGDPDAVGAGTEVRIQEKAVSGPGALIPPPLEGLTLKWRNTETLRRLAYLAERRR